MHGDERIVVQKPKKDEMEFKTFSGNETQEMFQTVKGDDMNLTMTEANVSMSGYVSEEVKLQQTFHFYNNTNFYVSFRKKFLDQSSSKQLAALIKSELEKHQDKISSVKIKKIYQTYAIYELGEIKELKVAAELLQTRQEILALEFLQRKRIFGRHADIDEMAKFKTKVRKQEPVKKDEKKESEPLENQSKEEVKSEEL
eukprot:403332037